jgi:hypothetical protein
MLTFSHLVLLLWISIFLTIHDILIVTAVLHLPDPHANEECDLYDPTSKEIMINLRRSYQKCKLDLPFGGDGALIYTRNKYGIPILDSGVATISNRDLDNGFAIVEKINAARYAKALGAPDSVPGQVLGARLGGRGDQLLNVFPQTTSCKYYWNLFEDQIHQCIVDSGNEATARVHWAFNYYTKFDTRPHTITYKVEFIGGVNPCSQMSQNFDND